MASSPPAPPDIVVVVALPATLLLYHLSTSSTKCGCGRRHLCPLLSLVLNFLSDWPTCSRHLVNTLASLYIPSSVRSSHLRLLQLRLRLSSLFPHAAHGETPVWISSAPKLQLTLPPALHGIVVVVPLSATLLLYPFPRCCCTPYPRRPTRRMWPVASLPAALPCFQLSIRLTDLFSPPCQHTDRTTTTFPVSVSVVVVPLSDIYPVSYQLQLSHLVPLASLLDWALLRCLLALLRGASCIGRLSLERGYLTGGNPIVILTTFPHLLLFWAGACKKQPIWAGLALARERGIGTTSRRAGFSFPVASAATTTRRSPCYHHPSNIWLFLWLFIIRDHISFAFGLRPALVAFSKLFGSSYISLLGSHSRSVS